MRATEHALHGFIDSCHLDSSKACFDTKPAFVKPYLDVHIFKLLTLSGFVKPFVVFVDSLFFFYSQVGPVFNKIKTLFVNAFSSVFNGKVTTSLSFMLLFCLLSLLFLFISWIIVVMLISLRSLCYTRQAFFALGERRNSFDWFWQKGNKIPGFVFVIYCKGEKQCSLISGSYPKVWLNDT